MDLEQEDRLGSRGGPWTQGESEVVGTLRGQIQEFMYLTCKGLRRPVDEGTLNVL